MDKTQWILCPVCGSKTRNKVSGDIVLKNYPLLQRVCRNKRREYLQKDIDKTLNLNENTHYLIQNRKAVLDEVKCFLSKKKREGSWTAKDIKNMIQEYEQPDANGRKKPYAGIVLWYLKKHLK